MTEKMITDYSNYHIELKKNGNWRPLYGDNGPYTWYNYQDVYEIMNNLYGPGSGMVVDVDIRIKGFDN